MRVAIFAETFLPKRDGVAHTVCRLLEHLEARGHASIMWAPLGAPARYAATRIISHPSFPLPFYPDLRLVRPASDLTRGLAEFEPDIVHIVNPAILGLAGLRRARELGVPVVASYHTDLPGYTRYYGINFLEDALWAYFRWLHNQADLNLCPSRFTKRELEGRGFERVHVWSRGVDAQRFHPRHRDAVVRARLGVAREDEPLLLYVGRLAVEKRVEMLRPLLDAIPQASLAIVGTGPQRGSLEQLFAGTHTHFAGFLDGGDLAAAYASADIFVFPGANETFGNVVLEAMASGLPVVAPNTGGPADHVRNGRNGFLFESDSEAELLVRTARLARDLPYARALGRQARAYAEEQTWTAILDGLLGSYASLIVEPVPAVAAG